jgi:hypothetical protein
MRTYGRRTALAAALALLGGQLLAVPVLGAGPDIQPATVEEIIFPGDSVDIEKTVTTPELPPVVDICLLEDETGSFADDIGNLNAAASDIYDTVVAASPDAQFAVAGFRDYPVSPFGSGGDWVYRRLSAMSQVKGNWTTGIGNLTAGGGSDTPEAQYDAIVAAAGPGPFDDPTLGAQGDCGWRDPSSGAQRVLVVATDAAFHVTDGTHVNSGASTIAALAAQDIIVIGLKAPGAGTELDALAGATGGSVQALSSDGSDIADAILAGLAAVEVEVSMESDCGSPISTTFNPDSRTVVSGGDAVFTETISVTADAPGGTYTCKDWALINGEILKDDQGEVIYETKTIKVPEGFLTGGGQINNAKGKNALQITTAGNAGYLADFSLVGHWNAVFHNVSVNAYDGAHFNGKTLLALQFAKICGPGPNPPPANANFAHFTFEGTLDGVPGWKLEVRLTDYGEPGKDSDAIRIELHRPGDGLVVYDSLLSGDFPDNDQQSGCSQGDNLGHQLDAGNLQIHSGLKD